MVKKYTIVNGMNSDYCIDYFFYIIIFILTVYLVIIIMNATKIDNFINFVENYQQEQEQEQNALVNTSSSASVSNPNLVINNFRSSQESPNLTIEQQLQEFKSQNDILKISQDLLKEKMKKQARALYLANNYYKIDDSSFDNELNFINQDFVNVRFPEMDFSDKLIITNQYELDETIKKSNEYKNLYKVGDVVIKPASSNVTKDTICYKDYETHLSNDPNFKKKYPDCMVCSVNPENDYKNTKSWKNTKTNIHKVCLFNPNATEKSPILNYNDCKKLCKLN